jgi:hypothetical protein
VAIAVSLSLQARPGDDLGKIALRSNIPLDKLLLDNVDQLPQVDGPLAGKLLQLCNPPRFGECASNADGATVAGFAMGHSKCAVHDSAPPCTGDGNLLRR